MTIWSLYIKIWVTSYVHTQPNSKLTISRVFVNKNTLLSIRVLFNDCLFSLAYFPFIRSNW